MSAQLQARLDLLANAELLPHLAHLNRGIEKEGLRTTPNGELAQTPHPALLGSALTHPLITTDYSEALLEFITPVHGSAEEVIGALADIHRFAYSQLGDEIIWSASMPCFIGGEDSIPIAEYGSSNIGKLKHVYRVGLAYRYGKMMQTIAGIHYNFSLPTEFWPGYQAALHPDATATQNLKDFQTAQYFALIRNFRRHSWLILYLYGASPALCASFLQGKPHQLDNLAGHSLYRRHATSLRMGDLGYQSDAQNSLHICYNSLAEYINTLGRAVNTPYPAYEKIGVLVDGNYRQLNPYLLQIENEYYSEIRPKRVTPSGRKPLHILAAEGVEYIEVRNLDINPFLPLGIDVQQIAFLDAFLLYCLFSPSSPSSEADCRSFTENKQRVINQGRDPALRLRHCDGREESLRDWAEPLLDQIAQVAEMLDRVHSMHGKAGNSSAAVAREREKLNDPAKTPSARILAQLEERQQSYSELAMAASLAHRESFLASPPNAEQLRYFQDLAGSSLAQQHNIEAQDKLEFGEFLARYLAQ